MNNSEKLTEYTDSCRGDNKKQKIIEKYNIKPIIHTKILNGQALNGCCRDEIKDSYYQFVLEEENSKDRYYIVVGKHCADRFIDLGNLEKLSLFNPFQNIGGDNKSGKKDTKGNSEDGNQSNAMTPLNKELYQAINLLLIYWGGKPPYGKLEEILQYLRKNPTLNTQSWAIEKFNDILGKDATNKTLCEMIEYFKRDNPLIEFSFLNLDKVLENSQQKSNITGIDYGDYR
jgi:hypothetical protein